MNEKIIAWWNKLTAKQRKMVALAGVSSLMMIVAFLGWSQATKKPIVREAKKEAVKEVKLGGNLLEKSQVLDSQAESAKLKQQIEDMRTGKIPINNVPPPEDTTGKITGPSAGTMTVLIGPNGQATGADGKPIIINGKPITGTPGQTVAIDKTGKVFAINPATGKPSGSPIVAQNIPGQQPSPVAMQIQGQQPVAGGALPMAGQVPVPGDKKRKGRGGNNTDLPPVPTLPPPSPNGAASGSPRTAPRMGNVDEGAVEYGDIAIVSYSPSAAATSAKAEKEDKKKASRSVYLPSGSFMEATLLSGLDAPTSSAGQGHPVPVLLRVKMPAVLPNDVKAALTRGCFVLASGKGNLATERAELLAVSISCMDRKGNAVIDQKIKGWLVDEDGRAGLKGIPTAKFGSMIARSMLAGFLGGVGKAFEAQAKSNNTLAVTSTGLQTLSQTGEQAIAQGIGSGISTAFGETQKFYMDLAKSMLPVISVGSTKTATLIIEEGVSLEIKKSIR